MIPSTRALGTPSDSRSPANTWRRRADILAFFDHHASNGPEAINGRLEALRRNALGFRTSPTTAGAHRYTAAHSTHSSTHCELRRAPNPLNFSAIRPDSSKLLTLNCMFAGGPLTTGNAVDISDLTSTGRRG